MLRVSNGVVAYFRLVICDAVFCWAAQLVSQVLRSGDSDGDGFLTREELREAFKSIRSSSA